MAAHNAFGATAEELAARLLQGQGWTILHRNWRFGHKEIDLIARRNETVAFVEVRARRSVSHGHPIETIGWRKRREIETAARAWIARHGRRAQAYRFDVITVLDPSGRGSPSAALAHVADAWRA